MAGTDDRHQQRAARAAEVIRLEARTIASLEARLDARFSRAIDMLLACEGLVVVTGVGKAGLVGQKISATLASTGTPSLYLHPTEALHGDLGRIRARDLLFAISNSGETAEVNIRAIVRRRLTLTGSTLRPRPAFYKGAIASELVQHVWPLIEQGRIVTRIHALLPWERVREAHELLDRNEQIGKVVLLVDAQRAQRVQMEVTLEGDKASGTLAFGGIGGRFYAFKNGKLSGNRVQFRTANPEPNPDTEWTIELVDENTVTISRAPLALVGTNILDLIAVLGGQGQLPPAPKVAAVGLPVATTAPAAQGNANAPVRGIVQDQSKALIPGVKITARNVDTGEESTAITDEAGRYAFPDVMPGEYTMTASLPGFQTRAVSNLSIGDTQLLQDFTLEVSMTRAYSHPR